MSAATLQPGTILTGAQNFSATVNGTRCTLFSNRQFTVDLQTGLHVLMGHLDTEKNYPHATWESTFGKVRALDAIIQGQASRADLPGDTVKQSVQDIAFGLERVPPRLYRRTVHKISRLHISPISSTRDVATAVFSERTRFVQGLDGFSRRSTRLALMAIAKSVRVYSEIWRPEDTQLLHEMTDLEMVRRMTKIAEGKGRHHRAEDQLRAMEALAETGSAEALSYLESLKRVGEWEFDEIGYGNGTYDYFIIPGRLGRALKVKRTPFSRYPPRRSDSQLVLQGGKRGTGYNQRMRAALWLAAETASAGPITHLEPGRNLF